jgi:hypothetical protein
VNPAHRQQDAKSVTIDLKSTAGTTQTLSAEKIITIGEDARGTYNVLVSNYNVNTSQYNYDTRVEVWLYEYEAATNLMLKADTLTNPPVEGVSNSFTKWASALGPNDYIFIRVFMNNPGQQDESGNYVTHQIHVAHW